MIIICMGQVFVSYFPIVWNCTRTAVLGAEVCYWVVIGAYTSCQFYNRSRCSSACCIGFVTAASKVVDKIQSAPRALCCRLSSIRNECMISKTFWHLPPFFFLRRNGEFMFRLHKLRGDQPRLCARLPWTQGVNQIRYPVSTSPLWVLPTNCQFSVGHHEY